MSHWFVALPLVLALVAGGPRAAFERAAEGPDGRDEGPLRVRALAALTPDAMRCTFAGPEQTASLLALPPGVAPALRLSSARRRYAWLYVASARGEQLSEARRLAPASGLFLLEPGVDRCLLPPGVLTPRCDGDEALLLALTVSLSPPGEPPTTMAVAPGLPQPDGLPYRYVELDEDPRTGVTWWRLPLACAPEVPR